jgi:hypothetical protein
MYSGPLGNETQHCHTLSPPCDLAANCIPPKIQMDLIIYGRPLVSMEDWFQDLSCNQTPCILKCFI